MESPFLWNEEPTLAFDRQQLQLRRFVKQWQRVQDKQEELLALIEQRRQETGRPMITEADAQALAEGEKALNNLDAAISSLLSAYKGEGQQ